MKVFFLLVSLFSISLWVSATTTGQDLVDVFQRMHRRHLHTFPHKLSVAKMEKLRDWLDHQLEGSVATGRKADAWEYDIDPWTRESYLYDAVNMLEDAGSDNVNVVSRWLEDRLSYVQKQLHSLLIQYHNRVPHARDALAQGYANFRALESAYNVFLERHALPIRESPPPLVI